MIARNRRRFNSGSPNSLGNFTHVRGRYIQLSRASGLPAEIAQIIGNLPPK